MRNRINIRDVGLLVRHLFFYRAYDITKGGLIIESP